MQHRKETITNWHYKHRGNFWQRPGRVHSEKLRQETQQNLYWLQHRLRLWNVISWRSVQCQRRRFERCLHHCSVSLTLRTKRHCGIGTHCRRRTLCRWGERLWTNKGVYIAPHFVLLSSSIFSTVYLLCHFVSICCPYKHLERLCSSFIDFRVLIGNNYHSVSRQWHLFPQKSRAMIMIQRDLSSRFLAWICLICFK